MWHATILAAAMATAPDPEARVLAVSINGASVSDGEIVWTEGEDARWWVSRESAIAWRLALDDRAARRIAGQDAVEVCATSGLERCTADDSTLAIEAASDRFDPLVIGARAASAPVPAVASTTGAYVNYDLSLVRYERWAAYASIDGLAVRGERSAALRLTTVLGDDGVRVPRVDWQLRAEDTRRARVWSLGSHRVGGIAQTGPLSLVGLHVGRDFALQPDVVTVHRPAVLLSTDRPIRAEAIVDRQGRGGVDVAYGTYLVETGTGLPGRGELQVVATDRYGDRRITRLAYYYAPQLLAEGLTDWSIDIGLRQRDPLVAEFSGDPTVVASWARGLRDGTTLRTQALADGDGVQAAARVDWTAGVFGVSTFGVEAGDGARGDNASVILGHEYIDRRFSLSARAQLPLGDCVDTRRDTRFPTLDACRRVQLAAGWFASRRWSLHAAYQRLDDARASQLRFASAGLRYDMPGASITFGAQRIRTAFSRQDTLQASLSIPLGRTWRQLSAAHSQGYRRAAVGISGPVHAGRPDDTYRLDAYTGTQHGLAGSVLLRGDSAELRAEAAIERDRRWGSVGVAGAIGRFEGTAFRMPTIRESFLLVDAGHPGIPVLVDRRPVGRTGSDGRLFVPDVRTYARSTVSVDLRAFPIDDALDTDEIVVVPTRAGALARFVSSAGSVRLRLVDERSVPIPAGSIARLSDGRERVVGRDGRVELPGDGPASLDVRWGDGRCRATLPSTQADAVLICEAQ